MAALAGAVVGEAGVGVGGTLEVGGGDDEG